LLRLTISDYYRAQLQELYAGSFRTRQPSDTYAPVIQALIEATSATSVLDYGCGRQELRSCINVEYRPYDPAFEETSVLPEPADIVTSLHVLEHVEPEFLEAVLQDLRRLTLKSGFHVIHTGPALGKLPDGRNAHLIQKPSFWWHQTLSAHFNVVKSWDAPNEATLLLRPRCSSV